MPLVREVARIVEQSVFSGQSRDAKRYVGTLLDVLNSVQNRLTDEADRQTLKTLIDYLANDLDRAKWTALLQQLEATWPELGNADAALAQGGNVNNIRIEAGMPREDALRIFEKSVNQRGTMFSTDHWLQPKLQQLRVLLNDPISEEQASALLDVLYERHWMSDLLGWLQGSPMPWQSFFVLREFADPKLRPPNAVQFEPVLENE